MNYPKNRKLKIPRDLKDKHCSRCNARCSKDQFFKNRGRYDGLTVLCKRHHTEEARKSVDRLKDAIFALLGDACSQCGFSDKRALQIDHKNGGGNRERKGMSPFKYYEKVLAGGRKKYQILCANHNFIKKVANNENITSRLVNL